MVHQNRQMLSGACQVLMRQRDIKHFERAAAASTGWTGQWRHLFDFRHCYLESISQLNQRPDVLKRDLARGVQETVISHLHEPRWQHVLEESAHKLHYVQDQHPPAIAPGLFVPNEDLTVLNFHDTAVGQGYPEDIGGKILEACLA